MEGTRVPRTECKEKKIGEVTSHVTKHVVTVSDLLISYVLIPEIPTSVTLRPTGPKDWRSNSMFQTFLQISK